MIEFDWKRLVVNWGPQFKTRRELEEEKEQVEELAREISDRMEEAVAFDNNPPHLSTEPVKRGNGDGAEDL